MDVPEDKEVLDGVRELLDQAPNGYRNLIAILQQVQDRFGYLPREGMVMIADKLDLSPSNVLGVASFYNQFRFTPPGRRHVRVCMGTACHIKQGELVMDQWKRRLEIEEDQRTEDGEYSIERVACVGACAMAPVSTVCDEVVGGMSPTKVDGVILQHKLAREQEEREAAKREAESSGKEREK